jgi:hypothetical protein
MRSQFARPCHSLWHLRSAPFQTPIMEGWKEKCLDNGSKLFVSNVDCPLSDSDVQSLTDFVTMEEKERLISEIQEDDFVWEGFDQRKRVQRFSCDIIYAGENDTAHAPLLSSLSVLRRRLQEATKLEFNHVSIEDYSAEKWPESSSQIVTSFESSCRQQDCSSCAVAYIPLRRNAIAHWNQPLKNRAMCWTLRTLDHQTSVLLEECTAYVLSGELLHRWRRRLAGATEANTLLIKFCTLLDCPNERIDASDTFGYVPSSPTLPVSPMPPMEDLLTIIVTTSPIRSNPSTELLEKVFETFRFAGDSFSFQCRKIIVCGMCKPLTVDRLICSLRPHFHACASSRRRLPPER